MASPPPQRRIIRASELAQYAYCARSWWLQRIAGIAPTNTQDLAAGTAAHQQHGRAVWLAGALRWAAFALALVAILIALLSA